MRCAWALALFCCYRQTKLATHLELSSRQFCFLNHGLLMTEAYQTSFKKGQELTVWKPIIQHVALIPGAAEEAVFTRVFICLCLCP